MVLTDLEIRALQALRAPGGMTAEQAWERWPASGTRGFQALQRWALAAYDGETWTITPAGRAACPFNNPLLAARPVSQPEEPIMSNLTGSLTYRNVAAAIVAAGPAGLTRKQLAERFGAEKRNDVNRIDAHIFYALKQSPAEIAKLAPGYYVGVAHMPVKPVPEKAAQKRVAEVPEAEVEKHARDYAAMADFDIEGAQSLDLTAAPAPILGEAASLAAVDKMLDALPKLGAGVTQTSVPAPFSEDIDLDDPEQVEFAIFSSGGLDMYTDQGNVTLSRDVLRKLRAFLGLFVEEAA